MVYSGLLAALATWSFCDPLYVLVSALTTNPSRRRSRRSPSTSSSRLQPWRSAAARSRVPHVETFGRGNLPCLPYPFASFAKAWESTNTGTRQ